LVPPGSYRMGSPPNETGRWNDESPLHPVTLTRGFWLGRTSVTAAQWQAVQGELPRDLRADDRPVVYVSHVDGAALCARLQERTTVAFRLPTEAEWEYACRGGTSTPYWGGRHEADL